MDGPVQSATISAGKRHECSFAGNTELKIQAAEGARLLRSAGQSGSMEPELTEQRLPPFGDETWCLGARESASKPMKARQDASCSGERSRQARCWLCAISDCDVLFTPSLALSSSASKGSDRSDFGWTLRTITGETLCSCKHNAGPHAVSDIPSPEWRLTNGIRGGRPTAFLTPPPG